MTNQVKRFKITTPVAILTAVTAVGTDLSGLFGRISAKCTAAGT